MQKLFLNHLGWPTGVRLRIQTAMPLFSRQHNSFQNIHIVVHHSYTQLLVLLEVAPDGRDETIRNCICTLLARSQFMAADERNLEDILQRNPSLSRDQFQARDSEALDIQDAHVQSVGYH